jgi:hypothetical protein
MEQEKIENVFAPSKPLPDMSSIGEVRNFSLKVADLILCNGY